MDKHTTSAGTPVRPEDIQGSLATAAASISKLRAAVQVLPEVNGEGHSECPFAQELYAEKERREAEVQAKVGLLHEHRWVVRAEIGRCERNLGTISGHASQLNSDGPRSHYAQAESQLETQLERWRQMLDRIEELIRDAEAALSEASAKPFPGGTSDVPAPPLTPPTSVPSIPAIPGAPLPNPGHELETIFAIDSGIGAAGEGGMARRRPPLKRDADHE